MDFSQSSPWTGDVKKLPPTETIRKQRLDCRYLTFRIEYNESLSSKIVFSKIKNPLPLFTTAYVHKKQKQFEEIRKGILIIKAKSLFSQMTLEDMLIFNIQKIETFDFSFF